MLRHQDGPAGISAGACHVSVHFGCVGHHAVGKIGDRGGPAREDDSYNDILCQYAQQLEVQCVKVGHILHRLDVSAAAIGQRARAFQRPGDELQTRGLDIFGIGRGHDLAIFKDHEEPHGGALKLTPFARRPAKSCGKIAGSLELRPSML